MKVILDGNAPASGGMSCNVDGFIKNCRSGVYRQPIPLLAESFPGVLSYGEAEKLIKGTLPYEVDGNIVTFERVGS